MGLGGKFWDLLRPYGRDEGADFLRGKRVAVDLSFWIVQHQTAILARKPSARKPYLRNTFFRSISLFSKMGAFPVFVTDGDPSPLKFRARMERFFRNSGIEIPDLGKEGFEGTQAKGRNEAFTRYVRECVELIELMGMPVIRADGEAEALCAQLNLEGYVDACITADSDAFLFGAKCVVKSFRSNHKEAFECYNISDIQAGLGLGRKQMIAVALLVGSDHDLHGVPGFGIETAVRFVKLFDEDDVLKRLCEVNKGFVPELEASMKFSGDLELPCGEGNTTSKARPSHCSHCGHPGNKRAHSKSSCDGCVSKGSENCVEKSSGFECSCHYCDKERKTKGMKKQENWQLKVCSRIVALENFPNNEIVEMFLNKKKGKIDPCLEWRTPSVDPLVDFLSYHLHWEPSFSRQKLLPMLSTIYLREIASSGRTEGSLLCDQFEFHSIHRSKLRSGHPFYTVKWRRAALISLIRAASEAPELKTKNLEKEPMEDVETSYLRDEEEEQEEDFESPQVLVDDGGWFLLTDENPELVGAAFPEQVRMFLEKGAPDSSKKKRVVGPSPHRDGKGGGSAKTPESPSKSSVVQLSIKEFYRATKVSARPKDGKEEHPPSKVGKTVRDSDRNLPKSVRRRLLFG